jgi:hypothetical protein
VCCKFLTTNQTSLNNQTTIDNQTDVNVKDLSKYSEKEAFLISDKDWKNVLPLVSVTTWTQQEGDTSECQRGYGTSNGVCVYPNLIYHDEPSGFDADSIIYFMQQYSPSKVTVIGTSPQDLDNLLIASPEVGAGLRQDQVQRVSPENYLSYWKSYGSVVYVEDNYELALLASTYASFINAPLIIKGNSLDVSSVFAGKKVICVGDVVPSGASCSEHYTMQQLQQKYVDKTKTDKIILVNPNDLNIKVNETFQPEKYANPISEIYSKTSLSAPILASAKHEIILSTTVSDYSRVDKFLKEKIDELYDSRYNVNYLTIIASPKAIAMSYATRETNNIYYSADEWQYARLDNDSILDLAVGRIFSLTSSDVSSNIQRSLFYDSTLKNENNILITNGVPFIVVPAEIYTMGKAMSIIGYNTTANIMPTFSDEWKNKFLISYNDHGNTNWAGINSQEIPFLDDSFVLTFACLTCAFEQSTDNDNQFDASVGSLFCANALRKGAIGFIGATDVSGYINRGGFLTEVFAQNETVGNAFMNSKNAVRAVDYPYGAFDGNSQPWYTLLGDPTLKLKTVHSMPRPELKLVSESGNSRNFSLTVPTIKVSIPEKVINQCDVPEQARVPFYFTTADNRQFEIANNFISKFNSSAALNPVASSENIKIMHDSSSKHFWIKVQGDDLFGGANDQQFTSLNYNITFFDSAPDFVVQNITFNPSTKESTFDIKNIGNKEGKVTSGYYGFIAIEVFGHADDDLDLYYNDNRILRNVDFDLKPGEKQSFSLVWPDSDPQGRVFPSQYYQLKVWVSPEFPKDFIQQNYDNDYLEAIFNNE